MGDVSSFHRSSSNEDAGHHSLLEELTLHQLLNIFPRLSSLSYALFYECITGWT